MEKIRFDRLQNPAQSVFCFPGRWLLTAISLTVANPDLFFLTSALRQDLICLCIQKVRKAPSAQQSEGKDAEADVQDQHQRGDRPRGQNPLNPSVVSGHAAFPPAVVPGRFSYTDKNTFRGRKGTLSVLLFFYFSGSTLSAMRMVSFSGIFSFSGASTISTNE